MQKDKKEWFFQEASLIRWVKLISKGLIYKVTLLATCWRASTQWFSVNDVFLSTGIPIPVPNQDYFDFMKGKQRKKEEKALSMKNNKCNFNIFYSSWLLWPHLISVFFFFFFFLVGLFCSSFCFDLFWGRVKQ